jgi:polar amino acid transport system substrate-binding protein
MMTGFKVGVAIKKGREDLLKGLAQGIKEMQSDGTQRELLKKYGLDPTLQITSETLRN